jgi:hypothetical protein
MQIQQLHDYFAEKEDKDFGEKIGMLSAIFGCQHKNLGMPITINGKSYRACIRCGARRHFNTETLETWGSFYSPPRVSEEM